MFFNSKKGVEGYVVILLITSLVFSLFLFIILQFIFESDPDECNSLSFDFDIECQNPGGYRVNIVNNGPDVIAFEIDGETNQDDYMVESGDSEVISVVTDSGSTRVIPIVFDQNNNPRYCLGEQIRANVEVIPTC